MSMRDINPMSTFTNTGKLILLGVGVILFCVAFWFFLIRPGQLKEEATKGKADAAYSQGRTASGQDAAIVTEDINKRDKEYEQLTNQGNEGIRSSDGASDPVSRASACATTRALCMQRSYRDSERCRTLLESCTQPNVGEGSGN